MVLAPCTNLFLSKNSWFINEDKSERSGIIKEIAHINFTKLIKLDLGNFMIKTALNRIESIEHLQFMNMPVLEDLSLCKIFDKSEQNNITRVSALNKCAFSSLNSLDLGIYLTYWQLIIWQSNSILQGWRYPSVVKI